MILLNSYEAEYIMSREIKSVKDNREKQHNYSEFIGRFNRAFREGFNFEAIRTRKSLGHETIWFYISSYFHMLLLTELYYEI